MDGKTPETIPELYFLISGELKNLSNTMIEYRLAADKEDKAIRGIIVDHLSNHWKAITALLLANTLIVSIVFGILNYMRG